MTAERISTLFNRYMDGNATDAERLELSALALMTEHTLLIKGLEQAYWEKMKEGKEELTQEEVEKLLHKISVTKPTVVRSLSWRRIAVAASIIIVLGLGTYFLFFNQTTKQQEMVKTTIPAKDVEAPKVTKAMITLADGSTVALDSVTSGTIAMQGNVNIIKNENGGIVYNGTNNAIEYNTLVNPKGSPVQSLTLVDGTKVWMNAESTLKFFTSVGKVDRRIEITGECYFEVTHDATRAFIVKDINRNIEVQVLGTHFNVNTYADEPIMKVTLLEGVVKVIRGSTSGLLKPGQQAQVSNEIKIVDAVNVAEVMAWKNGNFKFTRTDLKVIMREIGRWYDVEVSYEGNIPVQLYNVGVPRTANVSEVLRGLEFTGAHFSVEGKKIIVRP